MTESRRADAPKTTVAKMVNPAALDAAIDAAEQAGMGYQGAFAPGTPLEPWDGVRSIPRTWNYPVGYNLKTRADREGRLTFAALTAIFDKYDIANLCVEHRINDIRSLNWAVKAAEFATGDTDGAIAQARKLLAKPDGKNTFRAWLAMYLRDVLRYDAGVLYRQRNVFGQVLGLKVVSGVTIAPLMDEMGDTPTDPKAPAYMQFIQGAPWDWLTNEDLIYQPFAPRSDSMYGFSPIEAAIMTANTDMRFQMHWLNWFTEGNIPEGFATAPQDITTPEQLERWEAYWESMNTDARVKHKMKMLPHGTVLAFPKEKEFDSVFPMFLMRKICSAFAVTPADIGFTDDVNRATGDTQIDVQFRVGTLPLLRHIEDILTTYLQEDHGLDVVFEFDTGGEKEDRLATAQADAIYMEHAVISPSEVRERVYGLVDDSQRPIPRYFENQRSGPIPVRSLLDVAGAIDPTTALPTELVPLDTEQYQGTPGIMPDKSPGTPQFHRAPTDPDEPQRPALEQPVPGSGTVGAPAPAPAPVAARAAFPITKTMRSELVRWRNNSLTRVARGQSPRRFESEIIPGYISDTIWSRLSKARTRDDVARVFSAVQKATTPLSNSPIINPGINPATGLPWPPDSNLQDMDPEEAEEELAYEAEAHEMTAGTGLPDWLQEEIELLPGEVGRPKAEAWRSQIAEPTPQMLVDLRLSDYWAPALLGAFASVWNPDAIKDAVKRTKDAWNGGMPDDMSAVHGEMALRQSADWSDAQDTYDAMRADAFQAGQMAATAQIKGPDDDWTNWQPGNPDLLGLNSLDWAAIRQDDDWEGIKDTTLDRIANILTQGVRSGASIDDIARQLQEHAYMDPKRAEMIAHTESARLLTAASMQEYQKLGLLDWDLVISDGACDICKGYESENPHHVEDSGDDSQPPYHPRCRCSVSPHVPTADEAKGDKGKESADNPYASSDWDKVLGLMGSMSEINKAREAEPMYRMYGRIDPKSEAGKAIQQLMDASSAKQIENLLEKYWNEHGMAFAVSTERRTANYRENLRNAGAQLIGLMSAFPGVQFNLAVQSEKSNADLPGSYAYVQINGRSYDAFQKSGDVTDLTQGLNMVLNATMMNQGSAAYDNDVRAGFHTSMNAATNDWTNVVTHEFGHVLDAYTGVAARERVSYVRSAFLKSLGSDFKVTDPNELGSLASMFGSSLYSPEEESQMSGYARGGSNAETLAEAWSDVIINGPSASAENWRITRDLFRALRGTSSGALADFDSGNGDNPPAWLINGTANGGS